MDYYRITKEELKSNSSIDLREVASISLFDLEIALDMINEIEKNNKEDRHTVFICPVGPVSHYAVFVKLVNYMRINLKNVYFINMDEYLTDDDEYIDINHPLSFRGFMENNVYSKIDKDLVMPKENRIFPDPKDLDLVARKIEELGGVDVCYGGIGINGHLAFNEGIDDMSPEEFSKLPTRVLDISRETITVAGMGTYNGAMELIPRRCITVGIKHILSSKRVVLGCFRDWHRAVVRRTCLGDISASFPSTLLQRHKNASIVVTSDVLKPVNK